jgi:hypothetical protein
MVSVIHANSSTDATFSHVRLPILIGVLAGMVSWLVLASLEYPSFYILAQWIFGDGDSKTLYVTPGYYCIHRTILLVLCGVGGSMGIAYSRGRTWAGILFLSGVLIIVGAFASVFPR